ncbi:carboxylesterase family protein [Arthrobacter sp. NPDC055138]
MSESPLCLRAVNDGGVLAYRGIRYAALDGGARFAAAVPASGQLDTERLADVPVFPQLPSRLASAMGTGAENPQTEDAFYLNVWAPDGAEQLPVLIFIHGGAWMTGGGSNEWYDGARLSAQGLVVVTVNYRIGAVAHLAPVGAEHRPLQDLLLALQWVRENIRGLGGDPDRVTVAGQSAGGWYGHLLSLLPEAKGLLRRVAHLSMGTRSPWEPGHAARVRAAAASHLAPSTLAAAPTPELLRAGSRGLAENAGTRPLGYAASGYLPTAAPNIPEHFLDPDWAAARCHAEAVYLRYTADETGMFFFNSEPELGAGEAEADAFLASLPEADRPPLQLAGLSPYEQLVAASSWVQFQRFPTELAEAYSAKGIAASLHVFSHRSALPGLLSGHCLDLPFQFGNREAWADAPMLHGLNDDEFEELAAELISELSEFAAGSSNQAIPTADGRA